MSNAKLLTNVDFSYKENALQFAYDDESTLEMWTLAMLNDKSMTFMFFGDEQFDHIEDSWFIDKMIAFASKPDTLETLGIKSAKDLYYNLYRYRQGDAKSIITLVKHLNDFRLSRPIADNIKLGEEVGNTVFSEYKSWNGAGYDVILNLLICIAAIKLKEKLTPRYIRFLSNIVIKCNVPEWKMGTYFHQETGGVINKDTFNMYMNMTKWSDGHIDIAKLAKSAIESNDEKSVPPGLKKEMAKYGMDIIIDESVSSEEYKIWTEDELDDLVDYNFNDVLGTWAISKNEVIESEMIARDTIRELYPYTASRAVPLANLRKQTPAERDITSARLSGLVLVGENQIKPIDWPVVLYRFPVPVTPGSKELKTVDLLEYIMQKEEFVHPYFYEFFNHFRHKDTRSKYDDNKVKASQPITHSSRINIPYYYKGKPIDAYCRLSTGGAHGSTCAGLHLKNEEEINEWIKSDEGTGVDAVNRFTVDQTDVIHADFTSFYPMMASRMSLYKTSEGKDRYTPIIDYRVDVKNKAEELKEKDLTHTDEYKKLQSKQTAFKLMLNAPTGAANMHSKHALLPLDNKTLSMRLIGNMLIWVLGQRLVNAGAFIISTNTDGLFLSGISYEKADQIMEDYIKDYNMPVKPENVARFINGTTSTRVEFDHKIDEPSRAGGTLGHTIELTFSPFSIGKNITIPLISGNAVLHYMAHDKDWLHKPYDRSRLVAYFEEKRKEGNKNSQAWYHVHSGTKSNKLTMNGKRLQKVNRIVFTTDGEKLGGEKLGKLAINYASLMWNTYIDNPSFDFKSFKFEGLDFYEWEENFLEVLKSDKSLILDFIQKDDTGKQEVFKPLDVKHVKIPVYDSAVYKTKKAYAEHRKEILDTIENKTLGYYDETKDQWYPVKIWKLSEKVMNYPNLVGVTVNTRKELNEFDFSRINIDAYVEMAEAQLKLWKRTADVPQIGMKKVNDIVGKDDTPEQKPPRTKKDVATNMLKQYYEAIFISEFDI